MGSFIQVICSIQGSFNRRYALGGELSQRGTGQQDLKQRGKKYKKKKGAATIFSAERKHVMGTVADPEAPEKEGLCSFPGKKKES